MVSSISTWTPPENDHLSETPHPRSDVIPQVKPGETGALLLELSIWNQGEFSTEKNLYVMQPCVKVPPDNTRSIV